ncbi:MAG TPA: DNA methyltransferase, partial [Polyangiales bacterium]
MNIAAFIAKWSASAAAERANKDAFLLELCDVLEVPRPDPTTADPERDLYVFEKDALMPHEGGKISRGKIDLYRADAFILEAKQGADATSKKLGTAKRGTPGWNVAMLGAYGQALGYARTFDKPVPFLITCDIGHCFDLYAAFDGSYAYRAFPNAQTSRIFFADLEQHKELLRRIFTDPHSLDPAKQAAKVTREVATHLAELAKALEVAGHAPETVATFLMRCLFTMFAEDVGLLPKNWFKDAIKEHWLPNPAAFPVGIESLWRAMNEGQPFGFVGKLLHFNGGLFSQPSSLPLTAAHLERLYEAASCNWSDVEPAIFGTLLERALDPKERHALGAHYTPRAYVERLVRPTIEEPLRADWELVQAEVRELVASDKVEPARKSVRAFHQKLCATRVLDPACGSGNFLYVALDLFKRLESEVLALLEGLGEKQSLLLHQETVRVTPAQFLGIEIKRWAKEIAELVLWIGYLQHHFRTRGHDTPPPEPILQDYHNIECRDAVLAYDEKKLLRDEHGKPITRWDGETYKKSPVTGEDVPDESAQAPQYEYVNPRKAEWPKAEFVVGNPPYIGNKRMRLALGDGYVEALRAAHDDVPETSDLVMYWWNHAAHLARAQKIRRFGFITTNSITQTFNRKVVQPHLEGKDRASIVFAIPDHPWVESTDGAAVRVAMTVAAPGEQAGVVYTVEREEEGSGGEMLVELRGRRGTVHADLTTGAAVLAAVPLSANANLCTQGVILVGEGFRISRDDFSALGLRAGALPVVVKRYLIGKDIVQQPTERFVIDFFGLTEEEARGKYPALYQRVADTVRPARMQNRDTQRQRNWWLFGRSNERMRDGLRGLKRYVATIETSKFKPFVFLDGDIVPDHKLYAVATDDARVLGILSSRAHQVWALAAGGHLGVGNDPTWTNTTCFLPFAFPVVKKEQQERIRALAEQLDAHRKRQQAQHPTLTVTGMYNVLAKLRSGEVLSAKDKLIHEQGLISVLKQIHDDLDAAVFDAYGWPHDLSDEQILEKLVALNAERAEEERKGLVRWLRPEFQNPGGRTQATQVTLAGEDESDASTQTAPTIAAAIAWPKKLPERVAAVRDLLLRSKSDVSAAEVALTFKGAKPKDVEPVLDALVALGHLVAYADHA